MAFVNPIHLPKINPDLFKARLHSLKASIARILNNVRDNFSTKIFLAGMGVVFLIYLSMSIWVVMNAGQLPEYQQAKLASQTVFVEKQARKIKKSLGLQTRNRLEEALARGEALHETIAKFNLEKMTSGLFVAPIDGLMENTKSGLLPISREDGLTPFAAYRKHFNLHLVDAPVISIGIMNLGLSSAATEKAIKSMPAAVSIILSPYSLNPDFWVDEARANGHEVWLSLPTETDSYPLHDPGPHTLLIGATEKANKSKLNWIMGRTHGYIGFVTEPSPNFVKSGNDMRPILNSIYTRGLAFIDGSSEPAMSPQSMARKMNAPYASVDGWLDSSPNDTDILEQLEKLEDIARERGMAAGIINAYPLSYQIIRNWIDTLPQRGFAFAPLSAQTGL